MHDTQGDREVSVTQQRIEYARWCNGCQLAIRGCYAPYQINTVYMMLV
jgi:hypothetical protein